MTKRSRPRKREWPVFVGMYTPDDDVCTWSAARTERLCRSYLRDVYDEQEIQRDIRIERATLRIDTPKRRKTK